MNKEIGLYHLTGTLDGASGLSPMEWTNLLGHWATGLEHWTVPRDFAIGMDQWTVPLDWTTGLGNWTGPLDWAT